MLVGHVLRCPWGRGTALGGGHIDAGLDVAGLDLAGRAQIGKHGRLVLRLYLLLGKRAIFRRADFGAAQAAEISLR